MPRKKPPVTEKLVPPNWPAIEPLFIGGIVSISSIAQTFGISRAAIHKHAKKNGWKRDLTAQVLARADELVAQSGVTGEVAPTPSTVTPEAQAAAIEVNAHAVAIVVMAQRATMKRMNTVRDDLLEELEADQKRQARRRQPLVDRVRNYRTLVEGSRVTFGMERISFGLDDNQKPPEDLDSFESLRDMAEK